ncbi:hypothetical protein R3W88_004796 [Solanum pinnatisectum]|uniref:Uncharacterized protein n=1 Tax=Solanum pinnatisectum TaxID=50273 RepID=A0AAV9KAT2_9SOLN|nr:hypothetical protein R3W88_004796 [Solanum pinnatisectum]
MSSLTDKEVVSNVVDGALALLSRKKILDIRRHVVFADSPSLVDYTLLEMVSLILDLNLVHACTMEGYHLVELCSQDDSSAAPQELVSKNSHICQAIKGKRSSIPLPKIDVATVLEYKLGASQEVLNSKKDFHRRKTYQFEKNCKSRTGKKIKTNITVWSRLVLDKKLNSSSSSAPKKCSCSKVYASVKCNQHLAKASSTSPCHSLSIELAISRKYVPQNERDEVILLRTFLLKILQKELQGWADWANERGGLMLSTGVHAMNMKNTLAREQEAIKNCQAANVEKHSFEKDLSTIKQEKTSLQQQQEKANKQEEWVKQRFLQQADSLKTEKEQLCVQEKVRRDNFREKVERSMQKYKGEIQKCES